MLVSSCEFEQPKNLPESFFFYWATEFQDLGLSVPNNYFFTEVSCIAPYLIAFYAYLPVVFNPTIELLVLHSSQFYETFTGLYLQVCKCRPIF